MRVIVRLLLAVLVAFGLSLASAPERDLVSSQPTAALVDDTGDIADFTHAVSGPRVAERSTEVDATLASPIPVLYHHPLFVFRPPRTAAFN